MAVERRFLSQLGSTFSMVSVRSGKIAILVALMLLLLIPLYQLSDNSPTYYKDYLVDHISKYLDHNSTTQVYNNTLYQEGTETAVHKQLNVSSPCDGFPNMDGIQLVMKTGATEAFDKVPTQLLTNLQCVPDFLLFSDLEQQIGQYHIYNVLDRVDETIIKANDEFKLYTAQQACPISQKECTKDMKGGWDLDKYKFLNMVERTWEMRPNKEWYVFAEADTYVVWPNIIHWLRTRANPVESPYVGSVALINNFPFAHGGSGYVVSGAFMKKMIETIPGIAAKYDEKAPHECCGDLLISMALDEVGAKVKQAHPMFNGEKPNTLPYGPGHWCEPIFTMHHMNSEEVSSVWQYEQTRKKEDIMQIKDLYHAFFKPHLTAYRKDWDNMSDDTCYISPDEKAQEEAGGHEKGRQRKEEEKSPVEKLAHTSRSACALVCESEGLNISQEEFDNLDSDLERSDFIQARYEQREGDTNFKKDRKCFQWRYHQGICCTSKSFKFGKPRPENDKKNRWTSGWFVQGIHDWVDARGECDSVAWREPR